jgi:hypothetical protein
MGLRSRRAPRPQLPPEVVSALDLPHRDRVLSFATDDNHGGHLVASTWALSYVTTAGELALRKPWHLVDAGSWQPEAATLSVTWTDGTRPGQWTFRGQQTLLPETVRERVQASVVLSTRLVLGERRTGRVAIRQDFATRELIPQTVLARRVPADDPEVRLQVEAALADLRDQVGLPPR